MRIFSDNAMLALNTVERRPTKGIPTGLMHIMEHSSIERLAGAYPGSYVNDPHGVYMRMVRNAGCSMVDQYLADNPLTMGDRGYEAGSAEHGKTNTGGGFAVVDGMEIKDADDVAAHIEKYLVPQMEASLTGFDEKAYMQRVINRESYVQTMLGDDIIKLPYGVFGFPGLMYGTYGYEPYFTAYFHYPELMERVFSLQADYAAMRNGAAVKALLRAGLPRYTRLDHDMADSRGMLCSPASLEKLWVPHFIRAVKPLADADFTVLWHCDGNLMRLVPYLVEGGVNGFQGFQYEDGMDYIQICKMTPKRGGRMVIHAGVSVTRTLPFGTPDDVKNEIKFLVENGTPHMFLGFSSSCVPGTPFENIQTCVDGFRYYRMNGRQ